MPLLKTKKTFKEIYDENRLLYADKRIIETRTYDPYVVENFLNKFYAKRRAQKKMRKYLFVLSCFITSLLVMGIINAINGLMA